jgi:hypothetical protein
MIKQTEMETDPMIQGKSTTADKATKITTRKKISLVLLAAKPGKLVGDHNVELCSTLDDLLALAGGDIVSNLSAVRPV